MQLTVDLIGRVHALDNNGRAWRLNERRDDSGTGEGGKWALLPALPSAFPAPIGASSSTSDGLSSTAADRTAALEILRSAPYMGAENDGRYLLSRAQLEQLEKLIAPANAVDGEGPASTSTE